MLKGCEDDQASAQVASSLGRDSIHKMTLPVFWLTRWLATLPILSPLTTPTLEGLCPVVPLWVLSVLVILELSCALIHFFPSSTWSTDENVHAIQPAAVDYAVSPLNECFFFIQTCFVHGCAMWKFTRYTLNSHSSLGESIWGCL